MLIRTRARAKRTRTRLAYFRTQPRLEPLEERRLLDADHLHPDDPVLPDPADVAAAQQAATNDFYGVDHQGKDGATSRIGFDLSQLYEELAVHDALHPGTAFVASNNLLMVAGGKVSVDAVAQNNSAALQAQLVRLGMTDTSVAGSLISGNIPIANLKQLAGLSELGFARPTYRPITNAGAVTSQGDAAMRTNLARQKFSVDGTGLTVGVISDSFNKVNYSNLPPGKTSMDVDISNDDLPQSTQIVEDIGASFSAAGTDEGRAMAQLVHDVAPGAAIKFASAIGTSPSETTFAANIRKLADAGADIIVDDIGYFTEPFFQDGLVARAVNDVVGRGVAYFSAAGNGADGSYQSAFVDSGQRGPLGGRLHDFDSSSSVSTLMQVTVPPGARVPLSFQWDQPFKSLSPMGSASDVDLYVLGSDKATVLAFGVTNNVGGDPLEVVNFANTGFDTDHNGQLDSTFYIEVELYAGPAPGLLKFVSFANGAPVTFDTFATSSSTTVGHANAEGAVGVGAAGYFFTDAFGMNPPVLNNYSSLGGTPLMFGANGQRLPTQLITGSPQVVGPDWGNTTFFGQDTPFDTDTNPNFPGTSAAAPHVAAAAALMLQAAGGKGKLTPQEIRSGLEITAVAVTNRNNPAVYPFDAVNNVAITTAGSVSPWAGHGMVNVAQAIEVTNSRLTIADVTHAEGDSGFTNFLFTVSITGTTSLPITVEYKMASGTATAPADYVATSGTLTFATGGPASQTVTVRVVGDTVVEPDETFFVDLSNPTNAIISRSRATGTILNDPFQITVPDLSIVEGDSGTKNATLNAVVSGDRAANLSYSWATSNGTAQSGTDYLARTGVLNIGPTATGFTFVIPIIGDRISEPDETFTIGLAGSPPGKSMGTVTIQDNDSIPALFVSDVQVGQPDGAQATAVFAVALSMPTNRQVTVNYATANGIATAGTDYEARSGQLTFAPGEITKLISVPILNTATAGADRTFFLNLTDPTNSTVLDGQGVATLTLAPAPAGEAIIDDHDTGYSESGAGWTHATNLAAYYSDYGTHQPGNGSNVANWSFNNLAAGDYRVFTRWMPYFGWASNAPFTVFDNASSVGTVLVDERTTPADENVNGIGWFSLGTFHSSGGTLKVQLADNANGPVIADAVRIVPVDGTLLAPNVLHNAALPADVNGDATVSGLDVLIVINHLLAEAAVAAPQAVTAAVAPLFYMDVNGDGRVSAIDALGVINYLNRASAPPPAPSAALAAAAQVDLNPVGAALSATPAGAADEQSGAAPVVAVLAASSATSAAPAAAAASLLTPANVQAAFAADAAEQSGADHEGLIDALLT